VQLPIDLTLASTTPVAVISLCVMVISQSVKKRTSMSNELKKECGVGYYWCNTDKICKPLQEDGMAVGNGAIAGIGVGPQGEPGVKKRKIASFISFMKRGGPKIS